MFQQIINAIKEIENAQNTDANLIIEAQARCRQRNVELNDLRSGLEVIVKALSNLSATYDDLFKNDAIELEDLPSFEEEFDDATYDVYGDDEPEEDEEFDEDDEDEPTELEEETEEELFGDEDEDDSDEEDDEE